MRALVAAALAAASPLLAQGRGQLSDTTKAYVAVDAPVVALKNVRLIDGTGGDPRADQTIVIENGRISEQGTHAELLRLGGHYYRLYTQQFRHELETQYGLSEAVGSEEKKEAPEALAAD